MDKPDPYAEWVLFPGKQDPGRPSLPVDEELLVAARKAWPHVLAHVRLRLLDKESGRERTALAAEIWDGVLISVGKTRWRNKDLRSPIMDLDPPAKWSYRKLILWGVLLFLSIGWIVFYINAVTKNSSAVLSLRLILFSGLSAVTFLLVLVLFWKHNRSAYKRLYSQWERSFLCQRCGTLAE